MQNRRLHDMLVIDTSAVGTSKIADKIPIVQSNDQAVRLGNAGVINKDVTNELAATNECDVLLEWDRRSVLGNQLSQHLLH